MKYKVVVLNFPKSTTARHVKAIRLSGKMSLKDAAALVKFSRGMSSVPIVTGIEKNVAKEYCNVLNASGLQAEIAPTDDRYPMILAPSASVIYKWSLGFMVKSRSRGLRGRV